MFDREIIEELFDWEFEDMNLEIPNDIPREAIIEAFYQYVEEDHYEWLKNNLRSFFDHGNPVWNRLIEKLRENEEQ